MAAKRNDVHRNEDAIRKKKDFTLFYVPPGSMPFLGIWNLSLKLKLFKASSLEAKAFENGSMFHFLASTFNSSDGFKKLFSVLFLADDCK